MSQPTQPPQLIVPAMPLLAEPMRPLSDGTVGQDRHSAFPCLVGPLFSGELQLVWREGSDHYQRRDGRIMRATSWDGGHSYEEVTELRSAASVDFRDPCLSYARGALHMTLFTATTAAPAAGAWTVREWGLYSRLDTLPGTSPGAPGTLPYAAVCAPIVELPDGRLGSAWYGRKPGESLDSSWMGWSEDEGRTWSVNRIAYAMESGAAHSEPWLILDETGNDASTNVAIHFYFRWGAWDGIGVRASPDSGKTWDKPRKILDHATGRPTVFRTQGGTLLMVYRALPSLDAALAYSDDHGTTWQKAGTMLAAPKGTASGGGIGMTYAAMAQITPDLVHLVVGMEESDIRSRLWGGCLRVSP